MSFDAFEKVDVVGFCPLIQDIVGVNLFPFLAEAHKDGRNLKRPVVANVVDRSRLHVLCDRLPANGRLSLLTTKLLISALRLDYEWQDLGQLDSALVVDYDLAALVS